MSEITVRDLTVIGFSRNMGIYFVPVRVIIVFSQSPAAGSAQNNKKNIGAILKTTHAPATVSNEMVLSTTCCNNGGITDTALLTLYHYHLKTPSHQYLTTVAQVFQILTPPPHVLPELKKRKQKENYVGELLQSSISPDTRLIIRLRIDGFTGQEVVTTAVVATTTINQSTVVVEVKQHS